MTYEEARTYLEHVSKKGIVLGLSVMEGLMERLGNPERALPIVHIAGTNGKGSILAYIEQIFLAGGYHTARYVSPAVGAYEERFLLDGEPVAKERIPDLVSRVKIAARRMERETGLAPTVFEIETAMAFLCFKDAKADVVLLETGMGGRLDATNIVEKPYLSIIASVSYDHMGILGDTLTKIAEEKAGIIKKNCDVLLYPDNEREVREVVYQTCRNQNSCCYEVKTDQIRVVNETFHKSTFFYGKEEPYEIFLPGRHQIYNAATAVKAMELLRKWYPVSESHVVEGLRRTRWKARLEKISDRPLIYLDGAHNRDGAKKLSAFLKQHFSDRRILAVTGVLADKEYEIIMKEILPLVKKAAVITPGNKRALAGEKLLETAKKYCFDCVNAGTAKDGLFWALREAFPEDVVIIFGSLSFMDEIGDCYGEISKDFRA